MTSASSIRVSASLPVCLRLWLRVCLGVCLLLCLGLVPVAPAWAQGYFGRNKVQYKKLDFKVLKTDHFDIYYYPAELEGVQVAARMAERWHARLERVLAH